MERDFEQKDDSKIRETLKGAVETIPQPDILRMGANTQICMVKKTTSKLKKELDAIFSKFIRARDDHKCYTCGLQMEPNRSQCGHFVPRQYLATRYDEMNCHAQCYACNMLYNGQPSSYAARLERDFGKGTVELLEGKRKQITKNFPYEYWIEIYKEKVKQL